MKITEKQLTQNSPKACITGGAGGLGMAFALHYAKSGHDLILVDNNEESLIKVCQSLEKDFGVLVKGYCTDLCHRTQLRELCKQLKDIDNLEVLVNNAGFGLPGSFTSNSAESVGAMVDLHIQATIQLCHAVLAKMTANHSGTIINVSSLGGFRPGPGDIVYGATKRLLIHFSKSLQMEVKNSGVKVQALCPGFVLTDFHDSPVYQKTGTPTVPRFFWMNSKEIVKSSIRALSLKKVVVIPSFRDYLLLFMVYNPFVWRLVCGVTRRLL